MRLTDLLSFPNLTFSAAFKTKLELLHEEDKHDFVSPEAITISIAVSSMWTPMYRAMMSPGLDLSPRRLEGSMRMLEAGNAAPPGFG